MNHKKHLLWMAIGIVSMFSVAYFTDTEYLLVLAPLFCIIMMVVMIVRMGTSHDKK